jgi:hypothetical protein
MQAARRQGFGRGSIECTVTVIPVTVIPLLSAPLLIATGARGENALRPIGGNPESSRVPKPPAAERSGFDVI